MGYDVHASLHCCLFGLFDVHYMFASSSIYLGWGQSEVFLECVPVFSTPQHCKQALQGKLLEVCLGYKYTVSPPMYHGIFRSSLFPDLAFSS